MRKGLLINDKMGEYEKEKGYASYKTICDMFLDSMILCNDYIKNNYENIELYNGSDYDEEEDYYYEVYQTFLIDGYIDMFIEYLPDAIIYYDNKNDLYLLGVTHWGTSWDYVLTNVKIFNDYDKLKKYEES